MLTNGLFLYSFNFRINWSVIENNRTIFAQSEFARSKIIGKKKFRNAVALFCFIMCSSEQ